MNGSNARWGEAWAPRVPGVLQIAPHRLRMKQRAEHAKRQYQRPFHLGAMTDAVEAPIAEVLAIIGEQAIVILAEARAGAADDFLRRECRPGLIDDSCLAPGAESRQRDLLYRTALPESGERYGCTAAGLAARGRVIRQWVLGRQPSKARRFQL